MQRLRLWMNSVIAVAAVTLACGAVARAGTTPLGSAFDYQGRLRVGGVPYSGTADFTFKLYKDAAGGLQVGSTFAANAVVVTDGAFTATLDFGMAAFDGMERYLEIAVDTPAAGGVGPFTTLTPRQRIAPTPYALRALFAQVSGTQPNAVSFSSSANSYSGSSISLDAGTLHVNPVTNRVGIGTTAPVSALDVRGEVSVNSPAGGYYSIRTAGGTLAQFTESVSTPNDVALYNGVAGSIVLGTATTPGTVVERLNILPGGQVGIGTGNTAAARLHVRDGSVAGASFAANTTLALERPAGNFVNLVSNNGGESGVLMGNPGVGPGAAGMTFNSAGTPNALTLRTGSTPRMYILSDGRVSIGAGVTTPDGMLQVHKAAADDSQIATFSQTGDQTASLRLRTGFRDWLVGQNRPPGAGVLDAFFIYDDGADATRLLIDTAGNVGIGTTTPTQRLSVNGSAGKTDGPSWSVFSDARLKTGIRDLPPGSLERLLQLRGRNFEYTADAVRDGLGVAGVQTGFIAQEVDEVFPQWIDAPVGGGGYLTLTERGTTALLVEALRELRSEKDDQIAAQAQRIDALQTTVEVLQKQNREIEIRLAATEKAIEQLQRRP